MDIAEIKPVVDAVHDIAPSSHAKIQRELEKHWENLAADLNFILQKPSTLRLLKEMYWFGATAAVATCVKARRGEFR